MEFVDNLFTLRLKTSLIYQIFVQTVLYVMKKDDDIGKRPKRSKIEKKILELKKKLIFDHLLIFDLF